MGTISPVECAVVELDSFLNAIRCMLGMARRLYGAQFQEKNGRSLDQIVEAAVSENIFSSALKINSEFDFNYIQEIFRKYIYSKLENVERNCLDQLDWSLVEYYGLISTAENEKGPWNRLVGQKHKVLEYIDNTGNDAVVFFVEYDEFVIITFFAEAG